MYIIIGFYKKYVFYMNKIRVKFSLVSLEYNLPSAVNFVTLAIELFIKVSVIMRSS